MTSTAEPGRWRPGRSRPSGTWWPRRGTGTGPRPCTPARRTARRTAAATCARVLADQPVDLGGRQVDPAVVQQRDQVGDAVEAAGGHQLAQPPGVLDRAPHPPTSIPWPRPMLPLRPVTLPAMRSIASRTRSEEHTSELQSRVDIV